MGRLVAADDLDALNDVLRADAGYETVEPGQGVSYHLRFHRSRSDLSYVLAPVARATAALLTAQRPPVRKCANPACTRWFYDASRTGRRRWCEMAICGNRAKVSAFAERKRGASGEIAKI